MYKRIYPQNILRELAGERTKTSEGSVSLNAETLKVESDPGKLKLHQVMELTCSPTSSVGSIRIRIRNRHNHLYDHLRVLLVL